MISIVAVIVFSLFVGGEARAMQQGESIAKMPNESELAKWLCKDGLDDLMERTSILEHLAGKEIPTFLVMIYIKKSISKFANRISNDPIIVSHMQAKAKETYPLLRDNPEELKHLVYGYIGSVVTARLKKLCKSISILLATSNQPEAHGEFEALIQEYLGGQ